jgi:hypothetical protein
VPDQATRRLVTASLPILRQGSSDTAAVRRLQALLNALADAGLTVDGAFGPRTEQAVRAFQTARRLVVDGIAGPQTWTALLAAPGDFPEVIIQQPQAYDIVDDPILVAGIGRAFEATIPIRVKDANGNVLVHSFVQGGSFSLANFQGQLGIGAIPSTTQGTIEAGGSTGGDEGPEPDIAVIPIVFGRALDPTYIGFHPHAVRQGETLSGLAQAFYGNGSLFPRIFEANRNLLTDPNVIHVGQVLRIPFGADTTFPPGG